MRTFKVGVFEHPHRRSVSLLAYTRTYNPTWTGCCEHNVAAESGAAAKRAAMDEHRERKCPNRPDGLPSDERAKEDLRQALRESIEQRGARP